MLKIIPPLPVDLVLEYQKQFRVEVNPRLRNSRIQIKRFEWRVYLTWKICQDLWRALNRIPLEAPVKIANRWINWALRKLWQAERANLFNQSSGKFETSGLRDLLRFFIKILEGLCCKIIHQVSSFTLQLLLGKLWKLSQFLLARKSLCGTVIDKLYLRSMTYLWMKKNRETWGLKAFGFRGKVYSTVGCPLKISEWISK